MAAKVQNKVQNTKDFVLFLTALPPSRHFLVLARGISTVLDTSLKLLFVILVLVRGEMGVLLGKSRVKVEKCQFEGIFLIKVYCFCKKTRTFARTKGLIRDKTVYKS